MYDRGESCNAIAAAIALDLPEAISALVEHDSAKYNIHTPCASMGGLPIHVAAANGKLKCVKQLHALGANLDAESIRGTPVNLAARTRKMAVLKYLKAKGLLGYNVAGVSDSLCMLRKLWLCMLRKFWLCMLLKLCITHTSAQNKRTGCDMTPAAKHIKKSTLDKL